MTSKFNNVYVSSNYTIASVYEKDGPIADYFDLIYGNDLFFSCKTFEAAEEKMLGTCISKLIDRSKCKDNDIDYIISGDLQNQIAASDYALRDFDIPFLGIFNACATFGEGIIIGSNFIEGKRANKIIVSTSSHNMVAEKQFRNPTEYGAPKKKTTTFTATGAASLLLSNKKSKIRVSSITPGVVCDTTISDVNNMGAVMALGAADTIKRHLDDLGIKPDYYDLIVTGDLGLYGKKILISYLSDMGIDISKNYEDCGLMLYDIKKQAVFAGGSGPACSALVLCAYLFKEMERGHYKKILYVPTGAIFSPTRTFQKDSIPCIAHAVSFEVMV